MSARSFLRRAFPVVVVITSLLSAAAYIWLTGGSLDVRAFRLPSASMMNTLLPGDMFFVDLSDRGVNRATVVVITCGGSGDQWCVSRVIGMPGDTVAVRGHFAYVNGKPLREPYARIMPNSATDSVANRSAVVVARDHVWVLGDNRTESYDSRFWGSLPISEVHGRPVAIYWSWDGEAGVRWQRIGRRIR